MNKRWILAAAAAAIVAVPVTQHTLADSPDTATLTITASGADMEFRSIGLNPDGFLVRDGDSRTWQNLKPDTYVVVQAPPWGGGLSVECSDGVSSHQYDLAAGDDLSCTFTATGS
jgi:hypothetical protein